MNSRALSHKSSDIMSLTISPKSLSCWVEVYKWLYTLTDLYNSLSSILGDAEKVDEFSSRCYCSYSAPKLHRKNSVDPDDMDIEPRWEGINFKKRVQEKKYHSSSTYSRSRNLDEERAYKDRTLNAATYKEMIDSYLRNINKMQTEEEPTIRDQWMGTSNCEQKKEKGTSQGKDEEEMSETDMLWREMEMSMASSYLLEETKVKHLLPHSLLHIFYFYLFVFYLFFLRFIQFKC